MGSLQGTSPNLQGGFRRLQGAGPMQQGGANTMQLTYGGVPSAGTLVTPTGGMQPYKAANEGSVPAITGSPTGGSGATANSPEVDQARLDINSRINSGNDALARFNGQQNIALNNVANDYQGAFSTLTNQQQLAQRNYTNTRNNDLQDYQTARDGINSNTRQLLSGARRLMGAQGAGGGSADLFAAPLAAQAEGNNQNAVVKAANERNLTAMDQSHQDDEDAFGRSFNDLTGQRQRGENQVNGQFAQQRAEVYSKIQELTGQRDILNGGNYESAAAAAAPFTSRIQALLGNVDAYTANAPIKAQTVNLSRPDLAQYNLGRYDAPAQAQQDPTLAPSAYRTLTGMTDEQRRQLGY